RLRELVREKIEELSSLGAPTRPLDAGVDVFGVLAEDHHVHEARFLHGRGDAAEPAHGANAGVQVELLPERDIQGAEAAADRRGERTLDRHEMMIYGGYGVVGEPGVDDLLGLLAGEHLEPRDLPLPAVRL